VFGAVHDGREEFDWASGKDLPAAMRLMVLIKPLAMACFWKILTGHQ